MWSTEWKTIAFEKKTTAQPKGPQVKATNIFTIKFLISIETSKK